MLFLYRPRETWMPFMSPRGGSQQAVYNRGLQERFASTRRVAPAVPAAPVPAPPAPVQRDVVDALGALGGLHSSGMLTDAEFAAAKARLLSG